MQDTYHAMFRHYLMSYSSWRDKTMPQSQFTYQNPAQTIDEAIQLAQKFIHRSAEGQPICPSSEETRTMSRAILLMAQRMAPELTSPVYSDDPIDGARLNTKPPEHLTVSANARQEGGAHYGLSTFQHWDMVVLFRLDYFQGQITKYVMRWQKKNGVEDLKKAQHFLEKYIETVTQDMKTP